MKVIFYRTWLISAGLALLAACSSTTPPTSETASGVTQLFTLEPTPDRSTLQKSATGYLASLLADPANEEITLVHANPALITRATRDLAITLPNGKQAQFYLREFNTNAEHYEGWVGYKPSEWKQKNPSPTEIDFDPQYYLSIVRHGTQLVGNLLVDGDRYKLVTVGDDKYILIKVDESKLPSEAEPELIDSVNEPPAITGVLQPKTERSIIRLLFVTTTQARAKNPNYRSALTLGLQDVNQIAINSHVAITYELAGFLDADLNEAGLSFADLLNSVAYRMPEVAAERDRLRADLVSMLVVNSEFCGAGKLGPSKRYGFSAINCIGSLAHEIGHNFGMNHHWNGSSKNYINGYRYRPETGSLRFRTQMAYDCNPSCPRKPFYSNPRLSYQGQPLGTAENHDVSRAMNERRETVEDFYPPPDRPKMIESSEQASCMQAEADGTVSLVPCDVDAETAEKRQWKLVPRGLRTLLVNVHAERIGAPKACLRTNILKAVSMQPCPAGATNDQGLYWTKLLMTGGDMIRTYWTNLDYCLLAAPDGTVRVDRCSSRDSAQRWKWAP